MVNYLPEEKEFNLIQSIKAAFSRYTSVFINKSRARLGFTNIINTDAFVIKKDVLNKIGSFDFKDLYDGEKITWKSDAPVNENSYNEEFKYNYLI